VDNKLIAPKLLLNLPSTSLAVHNGGVIEIGPSKANLIVSFLDKILVLLPI
jgi:hypothetical protein